MNDARHSNVLIVLAAVPAACKALAASAQHLCIGALNILAAVVGAPSGADFLAAVQRLDPEGLAMLRMSLGAMGLRSQYHTPRTSADV